MINVAMSQVIKRFDGIIPIKRLIIEACRSSGPGGQNVNKKNTKVSVSFHLQSADWLPEETRNRLAEIHKSNITKEDCMDKLRCYISEAEQPPEPELSVETIELMRQRLDRASAERLREKRHKSMLKNMRSTEI